MIFWAFQGSRPLLLEPLSKHKLHKSLNNNISINKHCYIIIYTTNKKNNIETCESHFLCPHTRENNVVIMGTCTWISLKSNADCELSCMINMLGISTFDLDHVGYVSLQLNKSVAVVVSKLFQTDLSTSYWWPLDLCTSFKLHLKGNDKKVVEYLVITCSSSVVIGFSWHGSHITPGLTMTVQAFHRLQHLSVISPSNYINVPWNQINSMYLGLVLVGFTVHCNSTGHIAPMTTESGNVQRTIVIWDNLDMKLLVWIWVLSPFYLPLTACECYLTPSP